MEDRYIFESDRTGGGRIKPAKGGCGSLIVLIIIILIGIAVSRSDTGGSMVSVDQNTDSGYVKLTHLLSLSDIDYYGNGKGCIEYDLSDGGYTYLTGCLASNEKHFDIEYKASLIIYADGNEIYRVDGMVAGDAPIDFNIDIRNAQRIRIELSGHECFYMADVRLWTKTPD